MLRNQRDTRARQNAWDAARHALIQWTSKTPFWKAWKRRYNEAPKVTEAAFLEYYQTIFGPLHPAASTTTPDPLLPHEPPTSPDDLHNLLHSPFTADEIVSATEAINPKKLSLVPY